MFTFAGRAALALFGAIAMTLFAAAPPDFESRLRGAIRIPAPQLSFGPTNLSATVDGLSPIDPPADLDAELRRLRALADQSPDNALLHRQIGLVLEKLGRTAEGEEAFARECRQLRADFASRPEDPLIMARLGSALDFAQREEAESLFRRALAVGSDRWECHLRYAVFLQGVALRVISTTNLPTETALEAPLPHYERAVTLAGDRSALPGFMQAMFCMLRSALWEQIISDSARAESRMNADHRLMVEGLRQAERSEPEDHRILVRRLFFESMLSLKNQSEKDPQLPEPVRQTLTEGIRRLATLAARSPNQRRTADIWAAVGMLELFTGDKSAALEAAARAVRLDPLNSQAWELYLAMCVGTERNELRRSELQAQLDRPRPNPESGRTRLMAARGYQLVGQLEKAAAELAAGRKAEPDNLRLVLAEATLRLQRAISEPEALVAEEKLKQAMATLQREARGQGTRESLQEEYRTLWMHGLVTMAIRTALKGSVEDAKLILARPPKDARGENSEYFAEVEEILGSVP